MTELLLILFAYLMGSIPTGVVLARVYGVKDITKEGSGNIGATNVGRVAGKKAGIITLAGDALKGVIPILVVMAVSGSVEWLIAAAALAAFLGHIYPVFNDFKGGKGVATALGIFLTISPLSALAAMLAFIIPVAIYRYVSLGSIVAAGLIPAFVGIFSGSSAYIILSAIIGGIVIYRHKDNIKRLLNGEENSLNKGKKEEAEKPSE
ncbi:MAG: glycerol-3-phosphate 1-O-acyltransferase PlsY [bacterium]|nr:glycerol-3-phosphate 1-O-acyltransferase PlsY [bacterium]